MSSQYLTALLMAAPLATGGGGIDIQITDDLVSQPYVDMTVKLMERFGVTVSASFKVKLFVACPLAACARECGFGVGFGVGVRFSAKAGIQLIVAARWQECAWSWKICMVPDNEAHAGLGIKISGVRGLVCMPCCLLTSKRAAGGSPSSPQQPFQRRAVFSSLSAACWQ